MYIDLVVFLVGGCQAFIEPHLPIHGIGASLLYTLDIGSSAGQYIGYQILLGVGIGSSIQIPVIASQAFSDDPADIPLVTAAVMCKFPSLSPRLYYPRRCIPREAEITCREPVFQLGSGALGVSAAQSVFNNILLAKTPLYAPGVDPSQLIAVGATSIRSVFAAEQIPGILGAYMAGLKAAWAMGIGLAGVTVLISLLPEWKSIKSGSGGVGGAMA